MWCILFSVDKPVKLRLWMAVSSQIYRNDLQNYFFMFSWVGADVNTVSYKQDGVNAITAGIMMVISIVPVGNRMFSSRFRYVHHVGFDWPLLSSDLSPREFII
jgi:hypothetical protein